MTVTPPLPSDVAAAAVLRLPLAPPPVLRTEIRPAALSKVLELEVFEVPNVAVTVAPLPSLNVSVFRLSGRQGRSHQWKPSTVSKP